MRVRVRVRVCVCVREPGARLLQGLVTEDSAWTRRSVFSRKVASLAHWVCACSWLAGRPQRHPFGNPDPGSLAAVLQPKGRARTLQSDCAV